MNLGQYRDLVDAYELLSRAYEKVSWHPECEEFLEDLLEEMDDTMANLDALGMIEDV